ncbi:carbohydrate kinase [Actinorhabdospora filicis]|uniref:Carbohydrate kinase n=1 Tax=Actinorhabdospora filicis TaxID=1785913 RepID=A0A9W6SR96_9ACTN|nr:sugar kinase [Actinorhabdospora filicis]GLZ79286.1 carbohydrate kinase [Actinorhabdospora filicis]
MPTNPPPVLCVGETMAVVTPTEPLPLAEASVFALTHGGAESNVAAHLSELGAPSAWLSRLGTDPLGDRVLAAVAAHGVDTRWVARDPEAPTGLYLKDPRPGGTRVHYYRRGSAASRMSPEDIAGWPLEGARWLHLSGITPALSPGCAALVPALIARARELGVPVSFDVNHRPGLWTAEAAAPVLLELARSADVVLVGRDEAEGLWGTATAEDAAALLAGPSHVVVKDADREAVEFAPDGVHRLPARPVDVVEPVGAGDAFAAGWLAARLRGDGPQARLALGHSLAAWTLGATGDHRPGHGREVRGEDRAGAATS